MPPAKNVETATPLMVSADGGLKLPSVVVKLTCVPLWTGVPPDSITIARTCVWPFNGSVPWSIETEMVEAVGAVRGTRSQATTATQVTTAITHRRVETEIVSGNDEPTNRPLNCTNGPDKDNRLMELAGQPFDFAHGRGNRGYAMAALLVAMSVMAVLMSALLPVWSHMATREKEEELIFRGKQYARAIGLFQRKYANTAPPTIDLLVEQRFLRKKYKDPITNDDFQPIYANQPAQQGQGTSTVAQRPGQQATTTISTPAQQPIQSGFASTGVGNQGGVIGVTSKSKDASLKIYNGRDHYNEWAFVFVQTAQRAGQSAGPGGVGPNQQGRPGQGQQPGPFGMQPGSMPPGGRGPNGERLEPAQPNGFGQPNRPPIQPFPMPGVTPPGQPRRPGGQ